MVIDFVPDITKDNQRIVKKIQTPLIKRNTTPTNSTCQKICQYKGSISVFTTASDRAKAGGI
jgi:hypothetical protein